MSRNHRSFALAVGLALAVLASACSSDSPDAQAEVQAVESTTTSATPTTAAAPAATEAVALTGNAVESLLVDLPTENGWLLPAGSWTSDVFSVGVEWTSPVDMYLEQAADRFVQLRPVDGGSPIWVFEPFEVASPQGWFAIPRPLDLAILADNPAIEVHSQTSDGPVWMDFTVVGERVEPGAFPCPDDAELSCIEGFGTRAWVVEAPLDIQSRLVTADPDLPMVVATYGDSSGPGANAALAVEIATSIRTGEGEKPEATFVSAVNSQSGELPAGVLRGRLGPDAVIEFAFDEPVANWSRRWSYYRTLDLLTSSGPQASASIFALTGAIDPEAEQRFGTERVLAEPPQGVDEVEAWLGKLVAIVDSGEATFGNAPAAWWDVTVDDTVDSSPCRVERWHDPDASCVDYRWDERWFSIPSGTTTRMYYVPGPEVWLHLGAGSDSTLDDALAAAAPLLDNLAISAVADG